jgi:hypothetical protein
MPANIGEGNMQTVNLDKLPSHARVELLDFYEFLLKKYALHKVCSSKAEPIEGVPAKQLRLGDLAVKLFGHTAGIELDLPRCPPHDPLEL